MNQVEWSVGAYARHCYSDGDRGTLVRLSDYRDTKERGRVWGIQYVQVVGSAVVSGGASFWWPSSEFRPLTDALDIIAADAFEAQRLAHAAKVEHEAQNERHRALLMALEVLRKARASEAHA